VRKLASRPVNFQLGIFTAEHAEIAEKNKKKNSADFAVSAVKS
jgi:hypothetical protein